MSNRKLAGALSILLLAVLFMAIGCGDGKRNSHTNLRKVNSGGTGDPKAIAAKAAKMKAIDDTMRTQAETGDLTGAESLDAGTYTLDEVMSYVKFMRNQDDLSAYIAGKVTNGVLSPLANDQVGLVGSDSDEARMIEIPRAFTIQAGGVIPAVSADKNVIYLAQLMNDGKLSHSLSNPGVQVELNLINRISTRVGNTGAYTFKLAGDKDATVQIRKVPGAVRMIVTIEEKKPAKAGKQNSTLIKKMIISYKVERTGAPTAAVPPVIPPAEGVPPAAPAAPTAPAGPAFGERAAAPPAAAAPASELEFPAGNPPVSQSDTAD